MSSRRVRGRGNNNNNTRGRQQQNIRNQQMDSNGPGSRIRGTPQQILDRYLTLARDATSVGDTVLAENLWQHAEHYTRLLNAATPPVQQNQQGAPQQSANGEDAGNDDGEADGTAAAQPQYQAPAPRETLSDRETAPIVDPNAGEQPATPPVWGEGQESAGEQPVEEQPAAPPRRRRRTRFQRQPDADGNASAENAGNADLPTLTPNGELSVPVAPPIQLGDALAIEPSAGAVEKPTDTTLVE
jgi:hypothetical protein